MFDLDHRNFYYDMIYSLCEQVIKLIDGDVRVVTSDARNIQFIHNDHVSRKINLYQLYDNIDIVRSARLVANDLLTA